MKFLHFVSLLLLAVSPASAQLTSRAAATAAKLAPTVLRTGDGKPVTNLKMSRDGTMAFVTANNGQVEVYDMRTQQRIREFNGGMGAYELAVSPDASQVASSTIDFAVSVNQVSDGTQRVQFGLGAVGGASALDWSQDGQMLAAASSNQVALFDPTGKMLAKREGAIGVGASAVAFSLDGTRLVAGWTDRTVAIYETGNFEKTQFAYQGPNLHQVAQLPGHTGAITALAWSTDGKFLASGDASGLVQIWDFATAKNLGVWTVGNSSIESLAWAPSGATVAVATKALEGNASVQLWDVAKSKAKLVWEQAHPAVAIAFSAKGQALLAGDNQGTVSIVTVAALSWFKAPTPKPVDLTKPLAVLPGNLETSALSWSKDGSLLARAGATQLEVRDLNQGSLLRAPHSHTLEITDVSISPDSKLMATSGYSWVEVADLTTLKVLWRREDRAVIAGWKDDSGALYVAEKNKRNRAQIALFDARSGTMQKQIGAIAGGYTPLEAQVSPTGDKIAVAVLMNYTNNLYTTMLEVWDIAGAKLDWGSSLNGWCDAIAWSQDAKTIAAKEGDRAHAYPNGIDFVPGKLGVHWYDATTGKLDTTKTRRDLPEPVEALALSPDGQTLVVSFERGLAQLWNSEGKFKSELVGSDGSITAWAFSSDGKNLAAGSKGSPLRIWRFAQ